MSREFEMATNVDAQPTSRRPASARRLDDEGGPTVASPKLVPPPADEA
jgi:hypothetical protein